MKQQKTPQNGKLKTPKPYVKTNWRTLRGDSYIKK